MKSPNRPKAAALAAALIAALALTTGHAATKNAIAYNKEGWEYLKKEDYKRAISSFRNALHHNPRYRDALIGLGKSYFEVEAYEQSYDLFTDAMAIDKKAVEPIVGMGRTLTALGRYTDAIQYFDRALKLSPENLDARYGTAYVYASLGKKIWAKRALAAILRIEPFHYDALLLMADIKSSENRLGEARRYAEKAIGTNNESSRGYAVFGEVLLREFLNTENEDLLDEAKESLSNAIAIQPTGYHANRIMGYISLMENRYDEAAAYFNTALSGLDTGILLYSLAVAHDRAGNRNAALEEFLKARKKDPADSVLRSRLEDFLVFRDYKIGNPARVDTGKELYGLATESERKNLPDRTMMYLRRAILMNPMDMRARELLMDFYNTLGYNNFYIDEIKEILKLTQDRVWQERLELAVMKRRELLYHREGYSAEEPPRDVPVVLVLPFDPAGRISPHPDAGDVIASHLTFVLGQYGRMRPVGIRKRTAVACDMVCGGDHLDTTLDRIEEKISAGEIDPVDYVVYGGYFETGDHITADFSILDYRKGYIIGQYTVTESGAEALPRLALRAAKRLFEAMPFRARVLKINEGGIVTNVGLFDGITPGEKLVIYKFRNDPGPGDKLRRKVVLTVRESDTLVSYAEPQKAGDMDAIGSTDIVFPLKKRRAKLIK